MPHYRLDGPERDLNPPDEIMLDPHEAMEELRGRALVLLVTKFLSVAPEALGNAGNDFYADLELAWQVSDFEKMGRLVNDLLFAWAESLEDK